jgi:hypothetical protein
MAMVGGGQKRRGVVWGIYSEAGNGWRSDEGKHVPTISFTYLLPIKLTPKCTTGYEVLLAEV